jgi:hypothetical protein
VSVTPADGAAGVGLDATIQVTAQNATVSSVAVEEKGDSDTLTWVTSNDNTQWTYTGGLDLNAAYAVTATAVSATGAETVATSAFHTITSANRLLTTVLDVSNGDTVGVAMPIELEFNVPIPMADQPAIIAHIAVVSDPPQPGGWYWFDSEDVHYRPESYWESGTTVTVDADLNGVDAGNGYWGLGNWSESFSVGAAHLTVVNTQTRTMQVYNGDSVATGQLADQHRQARLRHHQRRPRRPLPLTGRADAVMPNLRDPRRLHTRWLGVLQRGGVRGYRRLQRRVLHPRGAVGLLWRQL